MNLPFYISTRYLRATQKGSFTRVAGLLSIAGLAVGVSALLITLFILNGFERVISDKISQFDGHIRIRHFLSEPIQSEITSLDSIVALNHNNVTHTKFIQGPALLRKGKSAEGVILEGIESKRVKYLENLLVEGIFDINGNSTIIGKGLAEQLKLSIGEEFVLFDIMTLQSSQKRIKKFIITGLFHSGMTEYDNSLIFTSIKNAGDLFGMKGKVSGHTLSLYESSKSESLSKLLSNVLPYPFMVMSWKEKNRALFKWMDIQRLPILIIFGLISLVGIVNIISALAMITIDKIRQIALLKSLGLNKVRVNQIFLLKGLIIGIVGSLLGSLISVIIALLQNNFKIIKVPEDVYFMDFIPLDVNLFDIFIIFIIVSIASVLASSWPSFRAANINTARALKYE